MSDDFELILNQRTPYAALDGIAAGLAAQSMVEVRATFEADASLTPLDVDRLLAQAEPLILKEVRQTVERGWLALQPYDCH